MPFSKKGIPQNGLGLNGP